MKCNKCNNDYPSEAYFKVQGLCENCYNNMSESEKEKLDLEIKYHNQYYQQSIILDQRVGFGRRFAAYLIDYLILGFITTIIFIASGYYNEMTSIVSGNSIDFANIGQIIEKITAINGNYFSTIIFNQFIQLFYFSLEIVLGASLGKLILGIQIGDLQGSNASKSILINRYLFKHSAEIIAMFALIPFLSLLGVFSSMLSIIIFIGCFMVFGEARQALHDKLAKTAVYHKEFLEQNN